MCNSAAHPQSIQYQIFVERNKLVSPSNVTEEDIEDGSFSSEQFRLQRKRQDPRHRRQSDPFIGLLISIPATTDDHRDGLLSLRWREGYSASQPCKPRRRSYTDVPISQTVSGRRVKERQSSCAMLPWRQAFATIKQETNFSDSDDEPSKPEEEQELDEECPTITLAFGSFEDRFGSSSSKNCDKIVEPVRHPSIYTAVAEVIVLQTRAA